VSKFIKSLPLVFAAFASSFAPSAHAEVSVKTQVMQQGLFRAKDCKPSETEVTPGDCLCKADIKYPIISGLGDKTEQDKLNAEFKKAAEQSKCDGDSTSAAEKEMQNWINQESTLSFNTPEIIAIKTAVHQYSGGNHDSVYVDGLIIDVESGKILTPKEIFGKNLPTVNQAIYDAMIKIGEGTFPEEIEARKGKYIQDDKCNDCSILLSDEGIKVVFQTYSLAASAYGMPEVAIDSANIADPLLKQNLKGKKAPTR